MRLALTGVLSDRIANTDSETQSVIFGEGFGGVSDLKVGAGDGYLYVLSIVMVRSTKFFLKSEQQQYLVAVTKK